MPSSDRVKPLPRTPPDSSLRRFLKRTPHIPDYTIILLLAAYNALLSQFEPFHRMFSLDDRSKSYPHADPERVPVSVCIFYAAGIPAILIMVVSLLRPDPPAPRKTLLHISLLGLTLTLLGTTAITDSLKNLVGRPRPDLLARCKAAQGTPEHELVSWKVCTETSHHLLHDGWRSWPSGHSSFSFAGLGYLALWFAGQTSAFRRGKGIWRAVLVVLPLALAAWVAVSRTEDYRHDVWDVLTGSSIGIIVSRVVYGRYWRGVTEKGCAQPVERGVEGEEEKIGFSRVPDLEMGVAGTET